MPELKTVTSEQVREHAGLVRHVLNKLLRDHKIAPDIEREDLEAVGMWAVWEALRRYDPARARESTFICSYIWGYLLRYQRDVTKATGWHRTHGRIGYVTSYEQAVEDMVIRDTPGPDDTEAEAIWALTLNDLHATVSRMPLAQQPTGRALLEDRTLQESAERLGIARQTAYNHRDRALAAMADTVGR